MRWRAWVAWTPGELPKALQAMGITRRRHQALFSTHPPIEERIARAAAGAGELRIEAHACEGPAIAGPFALGE